LCKYSEKWREDLKDQILLITVYFFIYSFIGWVLESTYKSILQKKVVNSGFLLGPFCPIYGFGALIMYFSLKDLTNNIIVLFLFGLIVLSIFEYVVGLFLEIVFKTKYWDYSKNKFNIQGKVCLKNSLYWGALGVVFMRAVHPAVEKIVKMIPGIYLIITVLVLVLIICIDTIGTVIKLFKINARLKSWINITENIRNKINAIDQRTAFRFANINKLRFEHSYRLMKNMTEAKNRNVLLGSLKEEQVRLQQKLERRIERLRKAFPTMQSERLREFLNNMKKS